MRMIVSLFLVLLVGLFALPAHAEQVQLANGMSTLIHEDTRFPLVSLRISVRVGSAYEDPKTAGISHVLEHMVFKRTKKWANGTAAKKIEEIGGYLNAMTSFDYTTYLVDVPADKWKLGMEVLEQLVFQATFDPEELEKEKKVVIEELKRGEDSPHNRIFQRVQAIVFKGTGYARPIIGTEESINAITVKDIEDYIKKFYQPQSMFITAVGNVKAKTVLADIQKRFLQYKNTITIVPQEPIDITTLPYGQFVSVERAAWNKSYITIAMPIPGYRDIRSTEIEVLSSLLAGDLNAPLQKKYKYEKQLVDSLSVDAVAFRNIGLLYISAEVDPYKTEQFVTELVKDLAVIGKQKYSKENLEKVQFQLEDSLSRSRATLSKLASLLNYFQLTSNSPLAEENYLSLVQAVNNENLPAVATTWIRPDQLALVGIIPSRSPKVDFVSILKKNWPAKVQPKKNTQEENTAKTETVVLEDGKTIVFIPDTTMPYTSISIAYEGGALLATEGTQGLGVLTASMLSSGTKKYSALDIEQYQSSRSSIISATSGRTTFSINMSQPARFTKDMLSLLKDMIENPTFPEEDLKKEKQNQISAIYATQDNPTGLLFRELYPYLFPEQVYGEYLRGTQKSVEALDKKAIQAFWNKQRTQRMVFSVAGTFTKEDIIAFVKSLPKSTATKMDIPNAVWGKEHAKVLTLPDRSQAHILLTYPTVAIESEDTPALALLQAVLGGQSGILFRELREKNALAYTVRPMNTQSAQYGFFSYYIGTSPEKQKEAMAGFTKVINAIVKSPIANAEIERGKRQIEGDYYRSIQSFGARASSASSNIIMNLPLMYNYELVQKVRALTPADIHAVVKKYFANATSSYLMTVAP